MRQRQRGISLFIVLIVLLLSLVVVLGGLMVSSLNESIVGNQGDAQRAYGAAEALLDAAQRDIRLNGRYCNAPAVGQPGKNPTVVTGQNLDCTLRYPSDGNAVGDYMDLVGLIGGINQCATATTNYTGICISSAPDNDDFKIISNGNNNPSKKAQVWDNGIEYNNKYIQVLNNNNDYGGPATVGSGASAATPLALGSSRGKYWVEIFSYHVMGAALMTTANVPVPDGNYPFVFRITAMAKGLRGGTVSVLRTYYVPYPMTVN